MLLVLVTNIRVILSHHIGRPQVCPNYGFVRQLQVFAACGSFLSANGQPQPPSTYPAYVSWLRRQASDVRRYLSKLEDTVPIFKKKLYINRFVHQSLVCINTGYQTAILHSEFPTDSVEASVLLSELGITHVLSISPEKFSKDVLSANGAVHHSITLRSSTSSGAELVLALPAAVDFIEDVLGDADERSTNFLAEGGDEDDIDMLSPAVLVHSQMESRATAVVCAYCKCRYCSAVV
jgi:dual specificity phosphatase 12